MKTKFYLPWINMVLVLISLPFSDWILSTNLSSYDRLLLMILYFLIVLWVAYRTYLVTSQEHSENQRLQRDIKILEAHTMPSEETVSLLKKLQSSEGWKVTTREGFNRLCTLHTLGRDITEIIGPDRDFFSSLMDEGLIRFDSITDNGIINGRNDFVYNLELTEKTTTLLGG